MKKELKSLASDTAIYGVFTIVGRFLTFMLFPIYSNYLTVSELGNIGFVFSVLAFMNIIYSLGMESAYFRFFSKDDIKQSKKAFSHSFIFIGLLSGIISTIIFSLAENIGPYVSNGSNGAELIRYAAYIPFLDALTWIPFAYLRMTRKAGRFALTRFLMILITVGLNIYLIVYLKWDASGAFLANLIASGTGVLLFSRDILKNLSLKFDSKLLKDMIIFGIPTIPASLSIMILNVADRPILKAMTNDDTLGMYEMNYKLGIPMMLFVTVFEYAWKPFYLNHFKDKNSKQLFARIFTYFSMFSAIIFLTVSLYMDFMVRLPFVGGRFISPDFWSGMGIIPIILIGYYFNGAFNNFAAGFHITKQTKFLPIAVGAAAISNIILNIVLIPWFGYLGSAWATLVAYAVSALVMYYFTLKVYPNQYEWKRIILLWCAALPVYFVTTTISVDEFGIIDFLVRTLAIAVFLIILYTFRFFSKEEISALKKLIRRS